MWTDRHRTRHETRLTEMVLRSGLDEVARFLEREDPPGCPDVTPARHVLAGIAWHLRTGGGWRALPSGFPPWRTVSGWFRCWLVERTFDWLSHWGGLHRERAGRLDVATARLACVATLMAANALNNHA